jgi:hypothetical protein
LLGLLLESVYPRRVRGAKRGGLMLAVIQSVWRRSNTAPIMKSGLEPIAAVGKPPARVTDGDGRGQRPPERKRHIGNQAEDREGDPKYLPLHISILDASALVMPRRLAKMFQIQVPPSLTIPMIPQRTRHDP